MGRVGLREPRWAGAFGIVLRHEISLRLRAHDIEGRVSEESDVLQMTWAVLLFHVQKGYKKGPHKNMGRQL
jgi:hypothetical protein